MQLQIGFWAINKISFISCKLFREILLNFQPEIEICEKTIFSRWFSHFAAVNPSIRPWCSNWLFTLCFDQADHESRENISLLLAGSYADRKNKISIFNLIFICLVDKSNHDTDSSVINTETIKPQPNNNTPKAPFHKTDETQGILIWNGKFRQQTSQSRAVFRLVSWQFTVVSIRTELMWCDSMIFQSLSLDPVINDRWNDGSLFHKRWSIL